MTMLSPADFEQLIYHVDNGTARITLNRPEARNAFTPRLYEELRWAIRHADMDGAVDIIVLTGAGSAFSAGGDLKESFRRISEGGALAMHQFFDNLPYYDIRDSPKVVIAAINGACYAGGLLTALWCDLTVASVDARFALTEAKMGTADAFTPSLLFGRTPYPKLKQMLFTGKSISADEAERYGLIGEVVPAGTLDERIDELIGEVRETSAQGRTMYKRFLNELIPRPLNHGAGDTFSSMAAAIQNRGFSG
jgi:enoyl-CoA hydratase/carnithine racemase